MYILKCFKMYKLPFLEYLISANETRAMSCVGMKRGAGDELASPAKKVRQYLQEGYMAYGQTWAEQEFAAGEFPSSRWADLDLREDARSAGGQQSPGVRFRGVSLSRSAWTGFCAGSEAPARLRGPIPYCAGLSNGVGQRSQRAFRAFLRP